MTTEPHPLIQYLVRLEEPYFPELDDAMPTTEVVRWALGLNDYWAERAVTWIEQGVQPDSMQTELKNLVDNRKGPQQLRHRAMRFIRRLPRSPASA